MDCNCETTKKASVLQSKTFLGIITIFIILMMAFPLYAKMFYPKPKVEAAILAAVNNNQQVKFTIQGMTCEGCEEQLNSELSNLSGVIAYKTSYATRSSLVTFDCSKVDIMTIQSAIIKAGYTVKGFEKINSRSTAQTINEKDCSSTMKCCKTEE
jgi:copper chaperone CopZ